jgi:GNAT superfamily N-acetyltransferase
MKIIKAKPEMASEIAKVHVDSWKTTYKGLLPDEILSNLSYDKSTTTFTKRLNENNDKKFFFVALNGNGDVVGFVDGGPIRDESSNHDMAEIYAIYILESFQNQGIGTQLLKSAKQTMRRLNYKSFKIWVLNNNCYQKFYSKNGGKIVTHKIENIGEHEIDLISYIWTLDK